MKSTVLLVAFAATVAITNATCFYCGSNKTDRQVIEYKDLKYLDDIDRYGQYNNEPKNIAEQCRIVQKAVQKYALYAEKAEQTLKFSDPLNVVDAAEQLANGDIQYRNAVVLGLENAVLQEVGFDEIGKNLFSVGVTLKTAEIAGDYFAASPYNKGSGHFYITLKDVGFKAKFFFDQFLDVQPEIDAGSVTFGHHESVFTNEEVLKELDDDTPKVAKPYAYYYGYVNEVIKSHIANELFSGFTPSIAKRFERLLAPAVLFPAERFQLPKFNVNIAPGIQATVSNTLLRDMKSTDKLQKMINYTIGADDTVEMLFSFTAFDLRGSTDWTLKYNNGNAYAGRAVFAVDSVQTVIVAGKPNGHGGAYVKFAKTAVNGLEMILDNDDHCESIRELARERVPAVLEFGLKTYVNDQSETALKNQLAVIGEKYRH